MITIPSPQTKQWVQANKGEIFGNLYRTRNIDLDEKGYLKLAKRANMIDSSGSGKMLNCFFFAAANLYIVPTSTTVYQISSDLNTVASVTASGGSNPTLSIYGDGVMFNALAYFSTTSTLVKMDSALAFTSLSGSITLTSSKFHPLCVFESLNYLAVGDANTVKLYNTSDSLIETLTIPQEYEVTWLVYKDQNLYIGTRNLQGGQAKMFRWNGSGTAFQDSFGFNAEWSFSGCEYGSSIASITSNGEVVYFTGGGFEQIVALPVYSTGYQWWKAGVNPTEGKVQRRGMLADGKKLYIVLSGHIGEYPYNLEAQPSGLWCYDPEVGLYHKAGGNENETTQTKIVLSVDETTNEITLSSSTTAITGTPCYYNGGGLDAAIYYIIRVSGTVLKMARTITDALAGTAIDLTNTTVGTLYLDPIVQYGANGFQTLSTADEQVGAIAKIKNYASTQWFAQQLIWGSTIYTNTSMLASASTTGLMTFGFGENRGDFVITKAFSNEVKDNWNKVIIRAGGIKNSNDKVVVKYRVIDDEGMPFSSAQFQGSFARTPITWTSSTTFTTNADAYTEWVNADIGDEVSFLAGNGAGWTAHITDISENSGVFTVTIDETYGFYASGDSANVSVQNWIKLDTITTADGGGYKELPIRTSSKWIQIKCELRGEGIKIEDIQLINNEKKPRK